MTTDCYVFDLDGTLADLTHRLHYITPPHILNPPPPSTVSFTIEPFKPDWRAFFAAVEFDTVIEPVATLYRSLQASTYYKYSGTDMIILSGRSDECREATERWLFNNNLSFDRLYMRKEGDHRPDYKTKKDLLDQLLSDGYRPVMFFDDRKQVVDLWRSLGYTCLQVAAGEF